MANLGKKEANNMEKYAAMVMELPNLANRASDSGLKRASAISIFTFLTMAGLIIISYFAGGIFHGHLIAAFMALLLCWFIPAITMLFLRTLLSLYTTLVSVMTVQCTMAMPSIEGMGNTLDKKDKNADNKGAVS